MNQKNKGEVERFFPPVDVVRRREDQLCVCGALGAHTHTLFYCNDGRRDDGETSAREVDEKAAKWKSDYKGKTYYFCTPMCKRARRVADWPDHLTV